MRNHLSKALRLFPFLLMALGLAMSAAAAGAAPVVLGLTNRQSLSEAQVGRLLIGELRCAACHAEQPLATRTDAGQVASAHAIAGKLASSLRERAAPDLADVGGRVAPEFIEQFIASPATMHPGTTMPDLLNSQSPAERGKIAAAITKFLVAQSAHRFTATALAKPEAVESAAAGRALFHTIGCVACHSPRDEQRPGDDARRGGPPRPCAREIQLAIAARIFCSSRSARGHRAGCRT